MSNLRINIRFLWYHLQVTDNWKVSISRNNYHRNLPDGIFEIHEWNLFKKV
jgi:hypothetical protein